MLPTPRIFVSPAISHRIDRRLLGRLAANVRRAAQRLRTDPEAYAGLGLRIVDDREMAELHLEFMGEAGPTDVLSFSPNSPVSREARFAGGPAGRPGLDLRFTPENLDNELHEPGLGDLVLDWEAVERQARDRSAAALLDEATVLLVHGLAHLCGHDHRNHSESRAMHAVERRVLRALRTPDPPRPYVPRRRVEVRHG